MEEENGESSYQTRLLRGERRMTLMNKKKPAEAGLSSHNVNSFLYSPNRQMTLQI